MAWRDVGSAEEVFGKKAGGSFHDVGAFEEIFGQQPSAAFGAPGNAYAEQVGPRWRPSDERVAREDLAARNMLASDFAFADAVLKKAASVASAPVGAALRFGTFGAAGETADALHRDAQVLQQLGAESADRSSVPMAGRLSTAGGTLLGIAPAAALIAATGGAPMVSKALPFVFGAGRGSEAVTEAKDAGKTGWQGAKYAAREAAIETGTSLLFNKLSKYLPGFGGLEQLEFGREPIRKAVGKALLGTVGEVTEEDAIAVASAMNKVWSEVDPKATDDLGKVLYETTLDTLTTMGLGNSPRLIGSSLDVARRFVQRNPDQAKAIANVESTSRRDLAEAGLGSGLKEDREKAVENIREVVREIQAGDMARLDPGGRVMVEGVKDGVANVRGDFGNAEVGVDELTDHVPIRPRPTEDVIQPTRMKLPRYATPGDKQTAETSDYGDVQVDDRVTDTKYKISGKVVAIDGLFAEVANRHGHKRRVPLGRLEINSRPGIPRAAELQPYPEGVNEDFIRPTGGGLVNDSPVTSTLPETTATTEVSQPEGRSDVAPELPAERTVGRPRVERSAVTAAFPTGRVTDLPSGDGYRIELPNGRWGSVRYVDKFSATKEQIEASVGRRLSDEEYDKSFVKGAFTLTTDKGREYLGDFLIRLVDGNAEASTVRHEALHLSRAFGLISDDEYSAMAKKYGRTGMSDLDVEEAIARAHEVWRGPNGLWKRFKAWLNDLLSRFGVKPTADTAHSRIARGEVYHRKGLTADEALSQKRERAAADTNLAAAFHGTPHEVDRFSTSKIGTGEGAQAYGWGLYFAGKKQVAEYYRDKLTPTPRMPSDLAEAFRNEGNFGFDTPGNAMAAIRSHSDWRERWDIGGELADRIQEYLDKPLNRGRLYEVDLKPAEDEYLLWDKPLSEQSEKVKKSLNSISLSRVKIPSEPGAKGRHAYDAVWMNEQLLGDTSSKEEAMEKASKILNKSGIRGVKYEDAGSRYAPAGAMKYRARWSSDGTKPEVYDVATNKAIDKQFSSFSEADKWIATQENDADRSYNYVIFDDADIEITQRLAAELGDGKDGDAAWRESLANPGMNKQSRALVNETRRDMSRPDTRAREQVEAEADSLLRKDYEGTKRRVFEKAAAGGQLTDTETAAAKRIISRDGYKAVIAGDEKAMAEAADSIRAYTRAGTEQARGLQMRFDPHETPTERRQRQLAEAILEPSKDLKERIDAAIKAGDDALAKSLKEKAEKESMQLRQFLTDNGLLPTSKTELDKLLSDPVRIDRIVREAWARKGSAGSKAYGRLREYWNSAGLLSGPVTMVRNALGTPINYGMMLGDRMVAATGRALVGADKPGDVAAAFKHAVAGMWPAITMAARHAMTSYITETSTFDAHLGREPYLAEKLDGKGRYATPGMMGRIIRGIGWGPLRATDQFWKAFIGTLEVGREAYNMARSEGLTGEALSNRIAELTTTLDSDAWVKAMDTADKATFTEDGSEARTKFKRNVKALRESTLGIGGFILPFVDTPVNIAAQVVERSPIGLLYIAQKMKDNRAAGRGIFDGMSERLANQAVGWAMILGIGSLFSDDDDQWLALTSGSHAEHPYSLKIGNTYLSYQGVEPLASFFGMVTDAKNVFTSDGDVTAKMGGMFDAVIEQIANKPMLEGIADVLRVIQGRGTKTEDRGQQIADNFAMWATNFGPSWIPNLYRQTVRATRENMPETKIWAGPNDPDARWRRMRDRALVQAGMKSAETSKYDLFGNEKKATIFENPTGDFFYRLLSPMRTQVKAAHPGNEMIAAWNRQNPSEEFKVPSLSPTFTHAGKSYAMDDDQFARFVKLAGKTSDRLFRIANFDVERPTAVQMQQLEKIFEEASVAARDAMKQEVVGGKRVSVTAEQLAPAVRRIRMASLREQLSRGVAGRKAGETDKSFADRRKQHFASQAMAREELRRWATGENALPAGLLTTAGGE